MAAPRYSVEEFCRAWRQYGSSPSAVAAGLGMSVRKILERRASLAKRGIVLTTAPSPKTGNSGTFGWQAPENPYTPRINESVRNGYIVAFSDSHFWPGIRLIAFEALLLVLKELKPTLIVSNGDAFDGAAISRHDPLGWTKLPRVVDELDATKNFLGEIERAAPKARRIFVVGNHDSRFDRRLASEVSQFEEVPGMRLQDHLKGWQFCYAALVNEDSEPSFFVHNIRGGVHAPRNNVLAAGCTVFTGHLHSQKAMPVTTLLHDWEGVDCGMLAPRDGPQFAYISSRPTDWREGFAVQRYDGDGYRYPVELARVQYVKGRQRVVFRGEVILERREAQAA